VPNWCSNDLYIDGNIGDLAQIVAALAHNGEAISFDGILPTPPELLADTSPPKVDEDELARRKAKYGASDWYDWQLRNWGTKWGPHDGYLEDDSEGEFGRRLWYRFSTAWAPPIEAFVTISQRWPEVFFTLAYDEPGENFGGYVVIKNGEIGSEAEGRSRITSWADESEYAAEGLGYALAEATLPD